jgi:hypothetical protein
MQLTVVCDVNGAVVSVATLPANGLRLSIPNLPLGQREIQIDAPDIPENADYQELHGRLSDLRKHYNVDAAQNKLVARSGG